MSGLLVGLEVMRRLRRRPTPRYTYRYIVVPETIGSIAWLDANAPLVPQLKGGLFLEMLGLPNPHALQMSFAGDTELDRCFEGALSERDPAGWTGAFRTVIGNDERQFNGPGVRIPMLSLSRVLPPGHPDWPYREYHSDHDDPSTLSFDRIEESVALVLAMIDALEAERIPVNVHKGELFCSRYGVHIDAYVNPEGNKKLFDMLDRIDGTRSVAQIAQECGASIEAVRATVGELARLGVVAWRE
jgi:aminopeptidase-like protein